MIWLKVDGCALSWTNVSVEPGEHYLIEYEGRVNLRDLQYATINGKMRHGGPYLGGPGIILPGKGTHIVERGWFTDGQGAKESMKYERPSDGQAAELYYYGDVDLGGQILTALDEAIRACGGTAGR